MPIDDALDKIESKEVKEESLKEEQYSLNAVKTGLEEYIQRISSVSLEEAKQHSNELQDIKEKAEKIAEIIKGYDKSIKPASTSRKRKNKIFLSLLLGLMGTFALSIPTIIIFLIYDYSQVCKRIEKKVAYSVTVNGKQAQIIPVINGYSREVGTKVKIYKGRGNLDRIIYDDNSCKIGDSSEDYVELFEKGKEPRKITKGGADDVLGKLEEEQLLKENDVTYKKIMEEASKTTKLGGKQDAN